MELRRETSTPVCGPNYLLYVGRRERTAATC